MKQFIRFGNQGIGGNPVSAAAAALDATSSVDTSKVTLVILDAPNGLVSVEYDPAANGDGTVVVNCGVGGLAYNDQYREVEFATVASNLTAYKGITLPDGTQTATRQAAALVAGIDVASGLPQVNVPTGECADAITCAVLVSDVTMILAVGDGAFNGVSLAGIYSFNGTSNNNAFWQKPGDGQGAIYLDADLKWTVSRGIGDAGGFKTPTVSFQKVAIALTAFGGATGSLTIYPLPYIAAVVSALDANGTDPAGTAAIAAKTDYPNAAATAVAAVIGTTPDSFPERASKGLGLAATTAATVAAGDPLGLPLLDADGKNYETPKTSTNLDATVGSRATPADVANAIATDPTLENLLSFLSVTVTGDARFNGTLAPNPAANGGWFGWTATNLLLTMGHGGTPRFVGVGGATARLASGLAIWGTQTWALDGGGTVDLTLVVSGVVLTSGQSTAANNLPSEYLSTAEQTDLSTAASAATSAASSAGTAATNTASLPSMIVSNQFTASALALGLTGGLTAQQTRDAMALATTVGTPATGSIDAQLALIEAEVGVGPNTRTVTWTQLDTNNQPEAGVMIWASSSGTDATQITGSVGVTNSSGIATFTALTGLAYIYRMKAGVNFANNPIEEMIS